MPKKAIPMAQPLHVFIEEIIKEVGITFQDLSAIAVSLRAGSDTGLRIGVSAAKGLCFALGVPLIAVDTLQVLASQAKVFEGLIIPMLDARRMEVYSAIFTPNFENKRAVQAEIITENSFEELQENLYFVGDCAEKAQTGFKQGKPRLFGSNQISFGKRNEFVEF